MCIKILVPDILAGLGVRYPLPNSMIFGPIFTVFRGFARIFCLFFINFILTGGSIYDRISPNKGFSNGREKT